MTEENWYKIATLDGNGISHFNGSSTLSLEQIAEALEKKKFIKFDNLIFREYIRNSDEDYIFKNWDSGGESNIIPSVLINPDCIQYIMQHKQDPRLLPQRDNPHTNLHLVPKT